MNSASAPDPRAPQHPGIDPSARKSSRGRQILLSLVMPCYNEQEVLETTHTRISAVLSDIPDLALQFVYVNDGSLDHTESILRGLAEQDARIKFLSLSRNFGHQPAVSAGLAHADGDIVAVLDADLQDPPEVLLSMLEKWRDGFDVIYGIRRERKEILLKRIGYAAFYRIFNRITNINAPLDSGDFCLIDRRVLNAVNSMPEKMRFFRGLRSWIGFRQTGIPYQRASRAAGVSKYSFRQLAKLGLDGIFNFSTAPLTLVFFTGINTALLSLAALIFIIVQRIYDIQIFGVRPEDVPGFATLALMILFLGGIQLVSIGILGEYIGRIYQEVKGRPTYIVRSIEGSAVRGAESRRTAGTN